MISASERILGLLNPQNDEANSDIPIIELDEQDTKMNRVFDKTRFTYKSAIDSTVAINPTLHQQTKQLTREHNKLMKKISDGDPDEKMEYLKAKLQGIRVTGSYQKRKKPNRANTEQDQNETQKTSKAYNK